MKVRTKDGVFSVVSFPDLSAADADMVLRWRNFPAIRACMRSDRPIPRKEHLAFLKRLKADRSNRYWLVKDEASGEDVGVVYLNKIDLSNRTAFLGIYANPELRRDRKGTLMLGVLRDIAFGTMRLHTLKLEVISSNARALEFYRRNGFRIEGRLKESLFRGGRYLDIIVMGLFGESGPARRAR